LGQVRGGAEFKTAGILKYFGVLKRGPNKEIGPKDFFEIASNPLQGNYYVSKPVDAEKVQRGNSTFEIASNHLGAGVSSGIRLF
jgi:hypothetical protein